MYTYYIHTGRHIYQGVHLPTYTRRHIYQGVHLPIYTRVYLRLRVLRGLSRLVVTYKQGEREAEEALRLPKERERIMLGRGLPPPLGREGIMLGRGPPRLPEERKRS